jgi:glycosyltransferase involved in cell wall biosynthesis
MVPVKRLHLLIEALHKVNSKVEWRHIGSGPLESELNQLAKELPSNVVVKFLGNLSNKEVLENYSNEPTDLFINVSELEGIPVSIMEAFSCSIPVIATNVGGTSELVNDKNGILISKDVTPDELASFIDEFYNLNEDEKQVKSREAYEMWNNNYNAEKNYEEFASKLMNMMGLLHER